jgi:hypothetical protein
MKQGAHCATQNQGLSHGLLGLGGFTAPENIILLIFCIGIYYKGKFWTQASRQLCQSRLMIVQSMVQLT